MSDADGPRVPILMGATTYRLMSRLAADGGPGTDCVTHVLGRPGHARLLDSATLLRPARDGRGFSTSAPAVCLRPSTSR